MGRREDGALPRVSVIVTVGTAGVRAARDATATIPIVMAGAGDPVGTGLVQSLARPGGNITGLSLLGKELLPKNLQLLKEAVPRVTRVAMLMDAANPGKAFFEREVESAARSLGLGRSTMAARSPRRVASSPMASASRTSGGAAPLTSIRFLKAPSRPTCPCHVIQ